MFCTKCGKELEEGEKFCPSCGAKTEKGEVDFGNIVNSVSSKAREGVSYAADQIKNIDVNDAKGIFTNVTKQDSIVYLIVGVLLLLVNGGQLIRAVGYRGYWRGYIAFNITIVCVITLIALIFLFVYLFSTGKFIKGRLSLVQVVIGIAIVLSFFATLNFLPYLLSVLRLLSCTAIGAVLAVVGTIKLCKDMEQNKPVGVNNPGVTGSVNMNGTPNMAGMNNVNMNGTPNMAGMNNVNMNGVPIANYDPRFDYTPIGMWGYFLYNILFNIPLIGWICWIIFAVGGTRNINLRNFARSYICLYIVMFVMFLMIGLFVAALS